VTLLYVDGFAHGQTARYSGGSVTSWAQTSTPRVTGSYYVSANGSLADVKRAIPATAEVFTGIGFRMGHLGNGLISFWGDSAATQHVTVMVNSSGLVEVRRGSTSGTLLATGATGAAWTVSAVNGMQAGMRVA
jgi:hypothetical protein